MNYKLTTDTINRSLIFISIIFLVFIYGDIKLFPQITQKEKLISSSAIKNRGRHQTEISYHLETEFRHIDVSERVFGTFADYDSLDIGRSGVTNVVQTIGRKVGDEYYSARVNFINDSIGFLLVPFFLFYSTSLMLLYGRIRKKSIRSKLTTLGFVCSFAILIKYLFF